MIGVLAVVVGFGSSSQLAAAYGIAVVGAMTMDTILACIVAVTLWRWRRVAAGLVFALSWPSTSPSSGIADWNNLRDWHGVEGARRNGRG